MDKVLENLYISSIVEFQNPELLLDYKITHILSLCEVEPKKGFVHKIIPILDMSDQDMTVYFDEIVTFINNARKNGVCLVHCNAGVSRAPTAVIYYLFRENKMSVKDAGQFLKGIRPSIDPNDGFKKQLVKAEMISFIQKDKLVDHEIKCKMCRCTLANMSQTNQHEKGVNKKRFNKRPGNRYQGDIILCNKIFMDRMDWMGDISELEGVLSCPKCKNKVGGYKWDGEQCSCGVWIVPSIFVYKSKVDV